MLNKIISKIDNLEELLFEYAELNSYLFSHNKIFMISTNNIYKTPEYNKQPYTFKYGDFSITDYVQKYVNE